ncbi:MAG: TonB-dependent receptor [Pyrinomonadaceae bacterium MAG19_C2-C3]|nr:TonB-dependent receptor [Pyrinomonadaceae bacterium MAG19_C2-C3]
MAILAGVFCFTANAQDTVTGAFEGTVTTSDTGQAIAGAAVQIVNQQTGQATEKRTDARGRFYQGLLAPGVYRIRVTSPGFQTREVIQRLFITRAGEVVPVPVTLDPDLPTATPAPTPITTSGGTPVVTTPVTTPAVTPTPIALAATDTDVQARINTTDARSGGAFTEQEVSTLPLGSQTLTRTFDELAFLLPGVALPPQTLGSVAGPGQGAGVGSAGQFAVNGLRSRANNFTVDGSDNNDEDIGVRRQGFVALNSQPIESVQEYQAITLLAPAQFGRNIGAQVNAVSKSGGNQTHGTIYGLFNSSQLNARNHFDTTFGNDVMPLRAGSQRVIVAANRRLDFSLGVGRARFVPLDFAPVTVRNQSGGEDSFTLGIGGFALGGALPFKRDGDKPSTFYFISSEVQKINANQEVSFAVPTVAQRGIFGTGATSNFALTNFNGTPSNRFTFPVGRTGGNAVFSLFPFPNNPNGIYGDNTLTQSLPASARGNIASVRFDNNFRARGREQTLTGRYNFTDDRRDIPAVGAAIFSTLTPKVRTQNLSLFLNGELSIAGVSRPAFNQLRASYGRTRLNFEQVRDSDFLLPSGFSDPTFGTFGLLNAPLLENFTSPGVGAGNNFVANTGDVFYLAASSALGRCAATTPRLCTTEDQLGPVGQIKLAGFSPIGVDVFNFPQRRVNNTYQLADNLTLQSESHRFTFGVDTRRTELNSDLPRNARQLLEFNGVPSLDFSLGLSAEQASISNLFRLPNAVRLTSTDLAAAGAASGAYVTLSAPGNSNINLRFYQLDFFAQDEWRPAPRLSVSYGLRYEFNTPPRETGNRIERTFDSPDLDLVPGLRDFIDGRERIFDADYNNFAPRVGLAYSFNQTGRATILRAGYGIFYDQILGSVVSQSRNVFPSFLTANFAGGTGNRFFGTQRGVLSILALNSGAPGTPGIPSSGIPQLIQTGTINTFTDAPLSQYIANLNCIAGGGDAVSCAGRRVILPGTSGIGATLPERRIETPMAHHYSFGVERQVTDDLTISAAYVGTQGRKLLRFTTPNLGANTFLALQALLIQPGSLINEPLFFGVALPPGARADATNALTGGRPVSGVGVINLFETTASSSYNSLQVQARSRLRRALQLQANYTFSKANDDVSDVFDLAGASVLPQNSFNLAAERAPANFDARHRLAYNFILDFPETTSYLRFLFSGLQFAGTGRFQTGQPFTVNSIFDVNLDGNLTDRLDNTEGIIRTGDNHQPLRLTTVDTRSLLAPVRTDGRIARNSFRAGNTLELDLTLNKTFRYAKGQQLVIRLDALNFINRTNYGVPIRFLEAPAFGQATQTITPNRRLQIGIKYAF